MKSPSPFSAPLPLYPGQSIHLLLASMGSVQVSSVQSLSRVQLFETPWNAARQATLSNSSRSLLKLTSIDSEMTSNCLILVIPFPSCLQSFPASGSFQMSQFFESGGQSIGVSPSAQIFSNEYSGLISFKMHWLDLLAVQRTLKSLPQHQGSKASISCLSAFFKSNSHIHTWLLEKP